MPRQEGEKGEVVQEEEAVREPGLHYQVADERGSRVRVRVESWNEEGDRPRGREVHRRTRRDG